MASFGVIVLSWSSISAHFGRTPGQTVIKFSPHSFFIIFASFGEHTTPSNPASFPNFAQFTARSLRAKFELNIFFISFSDRLVKTVTPIIKLFLLIFLISSTVFSIILLPPLV